MEVNSVFLKDMPFMLSVGKDAWERQSKAQPVNITLRVDHVNSMNEAAASDDVSKCLDYGKLYKRIQSNLHLNETYTSVQNVAALVLSSVQTPGVSALIQIDLPKAALRAEGGFSYTLEENSADQEPRIKRETVHVRGIKCACIIGVNPHERRDEQIVVVQLTFRADSKTLSEFPAPVSKVFATEIAVDRYNVIINAVVKVR
jgi:FolB domain-containing protein